MTHEINSALSEMLGENIEKVVKELANIRSIGECAAMSLGDDTGDALYYCTIDLAKALSEVIYCHILDAIDAQALKNDCDDLTAMIKNGLLINSPKVINSPSEKVERKGK